MLSCPAPLDHRDIVELAHGGGGRKTARLIETLFAPAFRNPQLDTLGDGAILTIGSERLAFTTDTFVVKPAFFPGGDIGSLAVHGTVNDLAMCGAQPLYLSAGYLLEEGFPMRDLERVVASMAAACRAVGVSLVTGDTKVVDRGKGDGIYVNTSGIGRVRDGVAVGPNRAAAGDAVIVSGPIGDHGIAVMAAREGIDFETELVSDSAPVVEPVRALLEAVPGTHVPARPDARRPRDRAVRDRDLVERRHSPRRGRDPGARGGARRLRAARLRPAVRGLRGPLPGDRPRRAEGSGRRGDPLTAGWRGRAGDRRRRRRRSRPAGAAHAHRQPPAARAAVRRAAAEDLLA